MANYFHLKNETNVSTVASEEKTPLLSRTECNIMRGFAIIIIIIDNLTHSFHGVYKDNEFNFFWSSVQGFLNNLSHPDNLLLFNVISFFCPYGVMLFIFLSGYGLTLKYEKGNGLGTSHKDFIFSHYKKMFTMHAKGFALFLMVLLIIDPHIIVGGTHTILQILLLGNLNPSQIISPGPYWFFGMIMEMYVIYRLIIYRRSDSTAIALCILSLFVMAFTDPEGEILRYLRNNCFLAILPFCMGVLTARHLNYKSLSINKPLICFGWFILSFILLTLSKFNFYSWLFMPIFIIMTAITIVKLIRKVKILDTIFNWLGALSGVLFVVHPSIRELLLSRANESGEYYHTVFIFLFLSIVLSIILKPVFSGKK